MNTKLKCLLLDDELPGLTYLKMLCEQIPELEVVKAFNSPEIFLNESKNIDFDLCILDIEMPGITGLQVAKELGEKAIIFTTAYKDYAAEAFNLDASDYVRKPITKERLEQAVKKAKVRLGERKKAPGFVQFNTDKGKSIIYFDQLAYIKTSDIDSRDKLAWLSDGSRLLLKNVSFEILQRSLPEQGFARVNKQEIIAIRSVQAYSADEVTTNLDLPDGKKLKVSLSEVYKEEFLQKLKN